MPGNTLSKGEVFVIETDAASRDLLSKALQQSAYDVICFADGASLLSEAKARMPACVLLEMPPDRSALDVLRPGATLVQLGLGGEMTLPINSIVAKELQLRGTFRFDREFELAVRLMGEGLIDVKPLITAAMTFENAVAAFELASDRAQSMKVQLTF